MVSWCCFEFLSDERVWRHCWIDCCCKKESTLSKSHSQIVWLCFWWIAHQHAEILEIQPRTAVVWSDVRNAVHVRVYIVYVRIYEMTLHAWSKHSCGNRHKYVRWWNVQKFTNCQTDQSGFCLCADTLRRAGCPWAVAVQAVVRNRLIMNKIALATRGVERRSLETNVGFFIWQSWLIAQSITSSIFDKFAFMKHTTCGLTNRLFVLVQQQCWQMKLGRLSCGGSAMWMWMRVCSSTYLLKSLVRKYWTVCEKRNKSGTDCK